MNSQKHIPHRLYLTEDQMPRQWYNLRADMPCQPDPTLDPATLQPVTEEGRAGLKAYREEE